MNGNEWTVEPSKHSLSSYNLLHFTVGISKRVSWFSGIFLLPIIPNHKDERKNYMIFFPLPYSRMEGIRQRQFSQWQIKLDLQRITPEMMMMSTFRENQYFSQFYFNPFLPELVDRARKTTLMIENDHRIFPPEYPFSVLSRIALKRKDPEKTIFRKRQRLFFAISLNWIICHWKSFSLVSRGFSVNKIVLIDKQLHTAFNVSNGLMENTAPRRCLWRF